jgi:hypothetical protein
MKKIWLLVFIICVILLGAGCGTFRKELYYTAAPGMLPNTSSEMKTAGFWISRQPEPDKVILTRSGITAFNSKIERELKSVTDILKLPDNYPAGPVRRELESSLKNISGKKYYLADGTMPGRVFFDGIRQLMNYDALAGTIAVRYGLVIRPSDQRIIPAETPLLAEKNKYDFDILQNSALDIGTPVAILHETSDSRWYYVRTAFTDGWVSSGDIVFCNYEELAGFANSGRFVVVVSQKADVYQDFAMTQYWGYVRMGTRLPLIAASTGPVATVALPFSGLSGRYTACACYMKKSDVNEGYLDYTPRTIIEQAFKMLNSPYGWGGMYGEQDCSRFIQSVFATVGINLPRNSYAQAQAGRLIRKFPAKAAADEKLAALNAGLSGGITTLYLPGHIMLFLGIVDGNPYAIHDVWAYSEKTGAGRTVRVINRVAVTDLLLSSGTEKGSFLDRLSVVRAIQ